MFILGIVIGALGLGLLEVAATIWLYQAGSYDEGEQA